jgi:flagellar basal-body rod modification protein FlgD
MVSNIGQKSVADIQQTASQGSFGVQVATSARKSTASPESQGPAPQFGEVWNKILAQNGGEAPKPREVKKNLGKDDFLRLMITQMKYQDPSKPFEMEKMGSELAQLSNMEQLQNLNTTIKQIVNQDKPLERLATTHLIGKTVVVDRDRFPHIEGKSELLHYNLPRDAQQVSVAVVDSTGEVMVEMDLGAVKKGENSFNWDGKKSNTLPAKSGTYVTVVRAVDSNGLPIELPKTVGTQVIGVSFEGNDPILLVGDPSHPDKVDLKQVSRIVENSGQSIPGAIPLSQVAPVQPVSAQSGQKNFFSFEKGVGSKALDMTQLAPEAKRALDAYEQQAREAQQETQKGFPNGLGQSEEQAENTDFSLSQNLIK